MEICYACQRITVHWMSDKTNWRSLDWPLAYGKSLGHLSNARELLESSRNCPMCSLIKSCVLQKNSLLQGTNTRRRISHKDISEFERDLREAPISFLPCQDRVLFAQDERGGFHLRAVGIEVPVKDGFLLGQLHVYADLQSAAVISGDVIGRPPLERPDGAGCYKLMDSWLASCLAHHEDCRQTISDSVIDETAKPALPTRVVQIGVERGNALLRLVGPEGQRNDYIALSHSWDDMTHHHPLKTTSSSLEAYLVNIPPEQIPKTFQDAVAITRALGVHYLWIDSSCIIQDDPEDWRRESSMMGLIYERTKLTIAACHASNSSEGCFSQRKALPTAVELPHIDKFGIHKGLIFTTVLPSECKEVDENLNPLDTRAWTTQEWLLSRRMIFCLKDCLAWSCKTITQVETGSSVPHQHSKFFMGICH